MSRGLRWNTLRSGSVKNKYGSKRVERDGFTFDSKKEARRYDDLKALRSAGEVTMFLCQVPFRLPGGVVYRVDFQIFWADGQVTHEDVKGVETKLFQMKKRQVEALYPIEILVT